MIGTILRIFWIHLRRDRVVWLLTFIVPVIFFSIFAIIFKGQGRGATPRVRVAVVDEDVSDFSKKLVTALQKENSLRVFPAMKVGQGSRLLTQDEAEALRREGVATKLLTRADAEAFVRGGDVPAAIILPEGLGESFPSFGSDRPTVELLADTSDHIAPQVLSGMLQGIVMTAAPEAMMKGGIAQLEKWGGALTPEQRKVIAQAEQILSQPADQDPPKPSKKASKENGKGATGDPRSDDQIASRPGASLLAVRVVDVLGEKKANPVIAFYAAATAVMFLLFACANGAGGSLLEEAENGTLDRLLSSKLTMTSLLAGKWISFVLLGVVQVSVMFLWGWLVFSVELWSHLAGFLVMTFVTAAAAAALGMLMGTLCRTRGQLAGFSTTVILLMSAVGGSMFPRFMMSDALQTAGLFTFNAWALDGYQKVFWYEARLWQLWPQVLVLAALAAVFLLGARLLARRWETV